MTWTRLGDEFGSGPEWESVSDAAFRLYVHMLIYCNRNLTDGVMPESAAHRLCPITDPAAAITELVGAGFVKKRAKNLTIVNYESTQRSAEDVRTERRRKAEWQKGYRQRRKGRTPTKPSTWTSTQQLPTKTEVDGQRDSPRSETGRSEGQDRRVDGYVARSSPEGLEPYGSSPVVDGDNSTRTTLSTRDGSAPLRPPSASQPDQGHENHSAGRTPKFEVTKLGGPAHVVIYDLGRISDD